MIIDTTRGYCVACDEDHDATIERDGSEICYRLSCPRGERRVRISSDAELFLSFRADRDLSRVQPNGHRGFAKFRFLEITDQCNFRCPVCYASAGPECTSFLAVEEVLRRVEEARRHGCRFVSLTGGEPILHPRLAEIVRRIGHAGASSVILSNGLALSEGRELLQVLKREGLWGVVLQFDTFDPEFHERIRGNRYVPQKLRAAETIHEAGLRLCITTTVFRENLGEIGQIMGWAARFGSGLYALAFTTAVKAGRFEAETEVVDREMIIHAIVDSGAIGGITPGHFRAVPFYRPWEMVLHPDCGAVLLLVTEGGRLHALDDDVDIDLLFRKLQHVRAEASPASVALLPVWYLLRAARPGKRLKVLRGLFGLLRGRGSVAIHPVFIGEFMHPDYVDRRRLDGCAGYFLTEDGAVPGCLHAGARYYPGIARPAS